MTTPKGIDPKNLELLMPLYNLMMQKGLVNTNTGNKPVKQTYLNPLQNIPAYQMNTDLTGMSNPVMNGTVLNQDASNFYRYGAQVGYQGDPVNNEQQNYQSGKVMRRGDNGQDGYVKLEQDRSREDANIGAVIKNDARQQRLDYMELINRIRKARQGDKPIQKLVDPNTNLGNNG